MDLILSSRTQVFPPLECSESELTLWRLVLLVELKDHHISKNHIQTRQYPVEVWELSVSMSLSKTIYISQKPVIGHSLLVH